MPAEVPVAPLNNVLHSIPPRFASLRPPPITPPASSPAIPGPGPITTSLSTEISPRSAPGAPSPLLLSPKTPITSRTEADPRSVGAEASSTPRTDPSESDLRPSTVGGLVIPPFPPLVPGRRNRGATELRINGHAIEEWDEEVLIGGKKLPGWLNEEDRNREVVKLSKMIDDLDDPPFTLQRLAELLLRPTAYHTSLGKYLRAVEKSLLVTTPWEPPSYDYIPGMTLPAARSIFGGSTSSASSVASDLGDEDSMMPPGASTPMFSPIPFLVRDTEEDDEIHHGGGTNGRGLDDGLMSPLILGSGAPSVRSPTPEPDEQEQEQEQPSGNGASDPAHQPYLGRVDELDTGPIDSYSASPTINGHGHGHVAGEEGGTGEGGNMTPHGMSERPVPISSTTTTPDEADRRIAALPRQSLLERFVSSEGQGHRQGQAEVDSGETGARVDETQGEGEGAAQINAEG
ncbi:hypothetical protein BCR39DRAFT_565450 [Naematelia encephala]|uniref:PPP4R2-domain-containing protein n=1 Tax=Naematelia encephala TaxID=71784 RepID=A0A1Y2B1E5_9TREE|nr:hypothetical protein BCR39DRAFT_565450 [Naematelia encephala]